MSRIEAPGVRAGFASGGLDGGAGTFSATFAGAASFGFAASASFGALIGFGASASFGAGFFGAAATAGSAATADATPCGSAAAKRSLNMVALIEATVAGFAIAGFDGGSAANVSLMLWATLRAATVGERTMTGSS